MALYTPEERSQIAERVLALLREDERVERAELAGSGTSGYVDRWSDVDLLAVVADGREQEEVANSWIPRVYDAFPVLHHFAIAFGEHHVRGFLLENLLEVDIGFEPAVEELGEWPGPDAETEAGFGWHDALHAGVAIARGRPWRAQYYIGLLRWRTLTLACDRLGVQFDEYKGVDDLPAELLAALENALPRSLDRDELARASKAATSALLGELRTQRPDLAERLESPLLSFLDATA